MGLITTRVTVNTRRVFRMNFENSKDMKCRRNRSGLLTKRKDPSNLFRCCCVQVLQLAYNLASKYSYFFFKKLRSGVGRNLLKFPGHFASKSFLTCSLYRLDHEMLFNVLPMYSNSYILRQVLSGLKIQK